MYLNQPPPSPAQKSQMKMQWKGLKRRLPRNPRLPMRTSQLQKQTYKSRRMTRGKKTRLKSRTCRSLRR